MFTCYNDPLERITTRFWRTGLFNMDLVWSALQLTLSMSTPISSIILDLGGMGMGSWWEDMVCVWLLVWTLVCWVVYWLAVRFDSNSTRGPAHAIGTEFYPVLRLIELPSILGRIIVNFPIFRSKNRKFNIIKIPCLGTGTSLPGTCLYRFANQVRDTLIF